MHFHTDPKRATDSNAIPDAEVFFMSPDDIARAQRDNDAEPLYDGPGWYVWQCFPGCLPDTVPYGPHESRREAIVVWRELNGSGAGDDE